MPTSGIRYQVGDLGVDIARERVTRGVTEIRLSQLSFRLFALLVKAAPEWVSNDSLTSQAWPGQVVGPETVVQRVKLVREALSDRAAAPRYIGAARGRGYRIVAPVTEMHEAAATEPETHAQTRARWAPSRRRLFASASAVSAVIAVAVGVGLVRLPPSAALFAEDNRVAVLPFENLSPNPDDAFFADGLHHEVIAAIAERAPALAVISRTTMLSYANRALRPAAEIANELDATYIVEGTVRRDLERVHVTVNLIDVRSDAALWSSRYDLESSATPDLSLALAREIVGQIPGAVAAAWDVPARATSVPAAYDLYLKALVARNTTAGNGHDPVEALAAVEEPLTAAIALDPSFAAAYAERAAVRMAKFARNFDTTAGQLRSIQNDLAVAERLAPTAAKTHATRALYLGLVAGDFTSSATAFAAARAAGLADPMWMLDMTRVLAKLGRHEAAISAFEDALEIDPANPISTLYYATYLAARHQPQEALRVLDLALAAHPADERLLDVRSYVAFSSTGEPEALRHYQEQAAVRPTAFSSQAFDVLRWSGRVQDADDVLAAAPSTLRALFLGAGDEPVARYRGWADLARGDHTAAAADGRDILAFLASTEETEHNRFFRRLLAAEAYTFTGEAERAVVAAHESMALADRVCCFEQSLGRMLATVYAWSGAHDEAVDLLTQLAGGSIGIGPAEIVRDPLYVIPLGNDPRFRELAARLEATMGAISASVVRL
jgi:TolB-like protein/DNA-binding winged helix-turn-helix (wHTH) protein/Tfp pilus assembly protein PilF